MVQWFPYGTMVRLVLLVSLWMLWYGAMLCYGAMVIVSSMALRQDMVPWPVGGHVWYHDRDMVPLSGWLHGSTSLSVRRR